MTESLRQVRGWSFSAFVFLTLTLVLLASCDDRPPAETATRADIGDTTLATMEATASPTTSLPPPASPTPEPYGFPNATSTRGGNQYPAPRETATSAPPARATPRALRERYYLPFLSSGTQLVEGIGGGETTIQTPTPQFEDTPTAVAATPTPEPAATVDVAALESELAGTDRQPAFSKIGFHVTFLEEKGVLDRWMQELDAARIPIYLKTVDNAEPLYKLQQLMRESGVPHTLVFRATGGVPNYDLPPAEAAREHWMFHRDKFPPELDPDLVWVETVNEVDKNRSVWLAEFALETARLAMADGFRWAAFGWAPGEPEPENWQSPQMLEFLRLAGENPDRLAIAVHEGSLSADSIKELYPFRVGRFLELFAICDQNGIPRPTVLITEWGWEYDNIPPVGEAMDDISWAANLYAHFPQVKGAAIWNLGTGCCFGDVSREVHQLIEPLRRFNLSTAYEIPRPPAQAPTDPGRYD